MNKSSIQETVQRDAEIERKLEQFRGELKKLDLKSKLPKEDALQCLREMLVINPVMSS